MEIDFSSEEDEEELGGITLKNMGKLLHKEYKPKNQGQVAPFINQANYFSKISKIASPDIDRGQRLKDEKREFMEKFIQEKLKNDNSFPDF